MACLSNWKILVLKRHRFSLSLFREWRMNNIVRNTFFSGKNVQSLSFSSSTFTFPLLFPLPPHCWQDCITTLFEKNMAKIHCLS